MKQLHQILLTTIVMLHSNILAYTQAPNISYPAGSKTYAVGTTITPLNPTNTGVAVAAPGSVGVVTTLAGSGTPGYADGTGTAAGFSGLGGVAVDGSGNVYVANNDRIRKISSSGVVTTYAGSDIPGYADGTGTAASFHSPTGVAVDGSGYVYVADYNNNRIRKISPAGEVTTIAGSGCTQVISQTLYGCYADGIGAGASFNNPTDLAVDGSGNVYVADYNNQRIRKVSPSGVVTTLAGSGNFGYVDGTGTAASFKYPQGVAVDGSGNVYVADFFNYRIRKVSPSGVVTTLAGSGNNAYADGTGTAASFRFPTGVAVDGSGNVYVADRDNNRIRKVSPTGVVTTLAGSGTSGYADGIGTAASFNFPRNIGVDGSGNVYVADNSSIRKISQMGGYTVSPALPAGLSINATTGSISGTPTAATPASNYIVTAINASGSSSYTINIAIVSAPTISSFTPSAAATGSTVTITGTNFTNATAVSFGGVAATSFSVVNSTTITSVVGTGASGNVSVITAGGTASLAGFTYIVSEPEIS